MTGLSTLCYIEKDGKYLMLHRTVKKHDVNKDKWIGVGGHFEADESPEECLLREVWEETGYTLLSWRYRGIVTFVSGDGVTEYMSLFTSDDFKGEPIVCDEGVLEWVDKDAVWHLNIWEGDKIFFRLMEEQTEFFSLKLVYDGGNRLVKAIKDGVPMELFDLRNPDGTTTGVTSERGVVHREGTLHGTAHTWIVRKNEKSGYDVLLQKRSANKDSHPGAYDISSAGHIEAGCDFQETAIRELYEELGIRAKEEELQFVGYHRGGFQEEFYGRMFRDDEYCAVYVYDHRIDISALSLQKTEVEEVIWMDYGECLERICKQDIVNEREPECSMTGTNAHGNYFRNCINQEEFQMLGKWLHI